MYSAKIPLFWGTRCCCEMFIHMAFSCGMYPFKAMTKNMHDCPCKEPGIAVLTSSGGQRDQVTEQLVLQPRPMHTKRDPVQRRTQEQQPQTRRGTGKYIAAWNLYGNIFLFWHCGTREGRRRREARLRCEMGEGELLIERLLLHKTVYLVSPKRRKKNTTDGGCSQSLGE